MSLIFATYESAPVPPSADIQCSLQGLLLQGLTLLKEESVSRATSPQTLLQSSCLRFAGGLTRSPAAVLKKISLEGRAERGTFQKSLSTQCWRLRFSKGSQRVLGVHWGRPPPWAAVEPLPVPQVTFLSKEFKGARARPLLTSLPAASPGSQELGFGAHRPTPAPFCLTGD